jgi:hydroxymethylpyrimidine/phosphomethylpyrimidine kinase
MAAMGLSGCCAVTAVTWDDGERVNKLSRRVIAGQLDDGLTGSIAACVVGPLPSAEVVSMVLERLRRRSAPNIVLHPVIFARSGKRVLTAEGVTRLRSKLPEVWCVVAGLADAVELAGVEPGETGASAARRIVERGARMAIVLDDVPVGEEFVSDSNGIQCFTGECHAPGAGGWLAVAIACGIALGASPMDAYGRARDLRRTLNG